jgi:hypothetical protein
MTWETLLALLAVALIALFIFGRWPRERPRPPFMPPPGLK